MSISQLLSKLEAQGDLFRYEPRSRHNPRRRLYMTRTAKRDLENPNEAIGVYRLRGYVEAAMARWTLGSKVHADDRKKPRFLRRLCPPPPEIWEIRVTEPDVQVRLFGRFAEPDTIVLTKFHTRSYLRDKGSAQWAEAMTSCEKSWENLFPGVPPFTGDTIHEYVTENCDDFDLC